MADDRRRHALMLGLAALQDYADQAHKNPIRPTLQLRAILALLQALSNGDRREFVAFWMRCRKPIDEGDHLWHQNYERGRDADIAWHGVARACGFVAESAELRQHVKAAIEKGRRVRGSRQRS